MNNETQSNTALFTAVFGENCENARHIKTERISNDPLLRPKAPDERP